MSNDEATRMRMEERVREACYFVEMWWLGQFPDDRAALRQIRATLTPVREWLDSVQGGFLENSGPESPEQGE